MRGLFSIFLLLCVVGSYGQQNVQYTQNRFNYLAINPAMAGGMECMDFKMGFRTQWVGFEGAPKTGFATFSSRLKFKKSKSVFNHHGIGGMVESDVIGPFSVTSIYGAYAYHFQLNRDWKASAGLYGGVKQFRFNAQKIFVPDVDDPAINGSSSALIVPDFTTGVFAYNERFFAGLTIRQVLRNKWKGVGTDESRFRFHYSALLGYNYEATDRVKYIPSVMFRFVGWSMPSIDINVMAEFDDAFSIGLSYRNTDAVAAMMKVHFMKYFTLGYSFDFTTSKLRTVSSNTHELILGVYSCPRSSSGIYDCPIF